MDTLHLRKVDPDLTPLGYQQRDRLSRFIAEQSAATEMGLQITHLYTSAMYRSLLTAQPLGAALGLRPRVWPDLHESGGMYQQRNGRIIGFTGMTRSAILREFPNYVLPESVSEGGWYDAALGRESEAQMVYRAMRVADALNQRGGAEDVLALVSHANFLDYLLMAVLAGPRGENGFRNYYHINTAITRIDYAGAEPSLAYANRVDHLPAAMQTY